MKIIAGLFGWDCEPLTRILCHHGKRSCQRSREAITWSSTWSGRCWWCWFARPCAGSSQSWKSRMSGYVLWEAQPICSFWQCGWSWKTNVQVEGLHTYAWCSRSNMCCSTKCPSRMLKGSARPRGTTLHWEERPPSEPLDPCSGNEKLGVHRVAGATGIEVQLFDTASSRRNVGIRPCWRCWHDGQSTPGSQNSRRAW